MPIRIKFSTLAETRWYEYAIRFFLGGTMTVIAGLIAARWGPVIGGLFLAFPAIMPASATLIEKHEREKKERKGLAGLRRGKEAAALEAAGAFLGSIGLGVFGAVVWLLGPPAPALALITSTLSWLAISVTLWIVRRHMRRGNVFS